MSDRLHLMEADEVVLVVSASGESVTRRTVAYWSSVGLIPRAIRKRRDGAPRAFYPASTVDRIVRIRELQRQGIENKIIMEMLEQDPHGVIPKSARCPCCLQVLPMKGTA